MQSTFAASAYLVRIKLLSGANRDRCAAVVETVR